MLVAIDGPAGAGKSTVARAVAAALGFTYLDTGAMYRCVGLLWMRDPSRPAGEIAGSLELSLGERVVVGREDVTAAIRAPDVSAAASHVAVDPLVRAAMVALQRGLISDGDWVAEGRDIATVVAPDAEVKVFLTASDDVRADRRARELGVDVAGVLADQRERDGRDRDRAHSPLVAAADAVVLDTGGLSLDAVVDAVVDLARAYRPA
ncbi:MAG TPA: (d)CMP kinase [Solirubrobacteraceae bacterium]|jgi:cytidylate kinase|nr:(d)CMP kinase [Solirubrobacteraceae bacterium]